MKSLSWVMVCLSCIVFAPVASSQESPGRCAGSPQANMSAKPVAYKVVAVQSPRRGLLGFGLIGQRSTNYVVVYEPVKNGSPTTTTTTATTGAAPSFTSTAANSRATEWDPVLAPGTVR